jgi:hypothetical protein
MAPYQFTLILPADPLNHDEILDMADALGDAGCTDASIRGHAEGIELLFDRASDTLQSAISSAVADVEGAGLRVSRVELEREALPRSRVGACRRSVRLGTRCRRGKACRSPEPMTQVPLRNTTPALMPVAPTRGAGGPPDPAQHGTQCLYRFGRGK